MNKIWSEHCFVRFSFSHLSFRHVLQTVFGVAWLRLRWTLLLFFSCMSPPCVLLSHVPALSLSLSPSSGSVLRWKTLARAAAGSLGEFLTPAGGDVISSSSSSSSRCVLGFLSCSMDWDRTYRTHTRENVRCFIVSLVAQCIKYTLDFIH